MVEQIGDLNFINIDEFEKEHIRLGFLGEGGFGKTIHYCNRNDSVIFIY
jgi:hypothetical protein